MANLKEIRLRISSVKSTRKITSAMKMVSAAKFRKAQDAVIQMRPYADKLYEILTSISASLDTSTENPLAREGEIKKALIVVITSNGSLCGAFNANVIKKTREIVARDYKKQLENGNLWFYPIGKTGHDILKKDFQIYKSGSNVFDNLNFNHVNPIAVELMQLFMEKEFDKIIFVYNRFKNAAVQELTEEQFLPVKANEDAKEGSNLSTDYIFEPTKEYIVKELIPKSLKIQLYKALLNSFAAEHGARMTAMHKATDNATELIKDLTLEFNKARQAAITNEILEIVSGANALN